MKYLVEFFAWIMSWCYQLCPNYWWDIIIFTAITKVLQFPLSLWCHVNSLKMVQIMPESIRIKINYYGDNEKIGEETAAQFKREHYHPMLSLIPLAIQIVILMGFVKVIYAIAGVDSAVASEDAAAIPLIARVPVTHGGVAWIMPILAGAAAWLLGFCQNRISPLQREQSRVQQMTTNGISIAISLFLGCFVGMGVGLYWAASNLFSILVQLCCNATIRPASRIDYPSLRRAQAELRKLEEQGKVEVSKEDRRREKADYKRFFSVANKHLVFYSESSGFYKYFKNTINWLLKHSNLAIHYVTNDPNDQIFQLAKSESRIKPYYIGQMKTIPLMMKMDADMVVMTTPDLDRFQIKRSYVRKDIEYVYLFHGVASTHLVVREHAYDNFDTVLCVGQHHIDELRAAEKLYSTKAKTLVPCGYGVLDDLAASYKSLEEAAHGGEAGGKIILIAPSYQTDNILDSCLEPMLDHLLEHDEWKVIVRPHPQYKKRFPARFEALAQKCNARHKPNLVFETDFASNTSTFSADLLITDWSGIAYEYAFATLKPVLFVNTPMKVINKNYKAINLPVLDITLRDEVGESVDLGKIGTVADAATRLLAAKESYCARIADIRKRCIFNFGGFGEASGRYILDSLKARSRKKKGNSK